MVSRDLPAVGAHGCGQCLVPTAQPQPSPAMVLAVPSTISTCLPQHRGLVLTPSPGTRAPPELHPQSCSSGCQWAVPQPALLVMGQPGPGPGREAAQGVP